MTDQRLDQIVKGAPSSDISPTQLAASAKAGITQQQQLHHAVTAPIPHNDVQATLPSAPPQIYLNLLILEASLRLQYLNLRARLRLHVLLLAGLTIWITTFTYLLYFRPREDGLIGGSVYWMLETTYKFAWGIGVVTACLFYATGMYERGFRWPRKFVSTTNRGLRPFNMKVVITREGYLSELISWITAGWSGESRRVNFQILPRDIEAHTAKEHWNAQARAHGLVEEDIAPAGDVLRVLLLPKPFSPDFREKWDSFRADWWEKENARRSELRKLVTTRKREVARREGGWLSRFGWRGWKNVSLFNRKSRRQQDLEKLALREHVSVDRIQHRHRDSILKSEPHSRSSSRSSTPAPEGRHSRQNSESSNHVRRGSAGSLRRPRRTTGNAGSRLSATESIFQDQDYHPMAMTKRTATPSNDGDSIKRESLPPTPKGAVFASEIKAEPEET